MLKREDILAVLDIKIEEVEVPEWGGSVFVKSMTGAEKDAYDDSVCDVNGQDVVMNLVDASAKLCARTICDKDGKLLFTPKDVQELGKKNGRALERCSKVARRLSGYKKDDIPAIIKNSSSAQVKSSTTD